MTVPCSRTLARFRLCKTGGGIIPANNRRGLYVIGGTDKSVPYNIHTTYLHIGNHAPTAAYPLFASCSFNHFISIFYVGNGFDRSVFPNPRAFPFIQIQSRCHPGEQQAAFVKNRRDAMSCGHLNPSPTVYGNLVHNHIGE